MKIRLAGIEMSVDFGDREADLAEFLLQVFGKMFAGNSVKESVALTMKDDKGCHCCEDDSKAFSELLTEHHVQDSLKKVQEKDAEMSQEVKKVEEVKEELVTKSESYKFVIGECSCGQQHYLPIYENAKNPYGIKCRKCGKENTVDYNELVKQQSSCLMCGSVSEFWMSPTDKNLKKVDCRLCGGRVSVNRK